MMRFGLHCLMIAGHGAVALVESDFVGFYAHHCGWTRYFFFFLFSKLFTMCDFLSYGVIYAWIPFLVVHVTTN